MTGRHGYEARERQNEYFVPGEGISREVIQADICRYLGNDALVRPGVHNNRQGYFIRAYRNLTSEMIADLKADSARWEAELMRRSDAGYPRASYQASAIHEVRQEIGPSQTPPFSSAPGQSYSQSYMDPMYAQASYGTQSPPYQPPPSYPQGHSPFVQGQNPYPQAQMPPYSGQTQPPVTAEMHPAYTYAANAGYTYDPGRNNPRYQPGYDPEQDYTHSPVTSGMAYPATSAPDPRIPMDPRYTPESTYPDRNNRPQPTRGARR